MYYVPEPEDIEVLHTSTIDFRKKASDLFDKPSPVIPLHFDKRYLPKNICQKEYLKLFECMIFRYTDKNSSCSYDTARFQHCRKDRDIKILQGIKVWETNHISELDQQNRQLYLQGLTFKLNRLKEQYSKAPSTQAKQFKLAQTQSQINQIKWRMKYIQQILKNTTKQSLKEQK